MTVADNPKKTLKDMLSEEKLATLTAKLETAMVETYQPLLDFVLERSGNKGMDVTLISKVELTLDWEGVAEDEKPNVSSSSTLDLKFSPEVTHDMYEMAMRDIVRKMFAMSLEKMQ